MMNIFSRSFFMITGFALVVNLQAGQIKMVDDFNGNDPANNSLGFERGAFCDTEEDKSSDNSAVGKLVPGMRQWDGSTGGVYEFTYSVQANPRLGWQYAGFYEYLNNLNILGYDRFVFYIKGSAGGEKITAGLKDGDNIEQEKPIGTYLPGGITKNWKKISIPLKDFNKLSLTGMSSVISIVFKVSHPGSGTVYIDDVGFEKLSDDEKKIKIDGAKDIVNLLATDPEEQDSGMVSGPPQYKGWELNLDNLYCDMQDEALFFGLDVGTAYNSKSQIGIIFNINSSVQGGTTDPENHKIEFKHRFPPGYVLYFDCNSGEKRLYTWKTDSWVKANNSMIASPCDERTGPDFWELKVPYKDLQLKPGDVVNVEVFTTTSDLIGAADTIPSDNQAKSEISFTVLKNYASFKVK